MGRVMFRSIKTRRIVLFLLLALIPPLFLRVVAYPRVINAFKAETETLPDNNGGRGLEGEVAGRYGK